MELYPFQRKAVRVLKKILRNNSGAVLRADEGVGKTIITASLVETKHTLMVVPARIIKGIRCLLYTSPSPRDRQKSRMPSSA